MKRTTKIRLAIIAPLLVFATFACITRRQQVATADQQKHLHQAAADGDGQAIGRLLRAGGIVNAKNASGQTPLHLAAIGRGLTVSPALKAGGSVASLWAVTT